MGDFSHSSVFWPKPGVLKYINILCFELVFPGGTIFRKSYKEAWNIIAITAEVPGILSTLDLSNVLKFVFFSLS